MSTFAEPDDAFKPAEPEVSLHDLAADTEHIEDRRCGICNARRGQRHLATGRYPD